jgi:ABC-type multidrug transport system ATPase subunit
MAVLIHLSRKRGEGMENLANTDKIQGKKTGRQREKILDGVCRWLGVKDNKDIFRDMCEGKRWRNMIANAFSHGMG